MMRRQVIGWLWAIVVIVLLGMASGAQAAERADAARDLVQSSGDRVLEILRDGSLSDEQKFDRLVDVLDGTIDIPLVARLALGQHWRTATTSQQQEYQSLFREYALDTLSSRLNQYDGQSFAISGAQEVGQRDAVVSTSIQGGTQPLRVDWRFREQDGGDLVAIDLVVEGISLIVSLRSEFGAVVQRSGIDGLLEELRSRVDQSA